ncbi:lipopolysaccharide biosynthesis protein [Tautonia marina]|uniref:lipopolysaccharide biosynthesis protein n=1 Tax=Tautonia marina TaxID=2653855 RepID=UPI001F20D805|nr:oligosaccharide flippase family protein [Tautonia marina]
MTAIHADATSPTVATPVVTTSPVVASEDRLAVRDSLIVTIGGQLERAVGTLTALVMKWGLDPAQHGVYSGLRLTLDHANRASLGIGRGAVQEIPILRAAGNDAEATRVADVAFAACSIGALLYAIGLLAFAWWCWPSGGSADPIDLAWSGGLVAVAALVLIKRYQDFLIALHRAHRRFRLTTELAILDAAVFAALVAAGLWLAGLWGLLAAVGLLCLFNVAYLHARHPMRLGWAWDGAIVWRLLRTGLPILANSAAFAGLLSLDRVLILSIAPNGAEAAGYYAIALMGTGWTMDLAGRIASVMYTYFQTTIGRTRDAVAVAKQASRVVEAMAPPLAAGSAVAYLVAPTFLGLLIPRYAPGLEALRPLLPGTLLLGLALPSREAMIAVDRPYRLALVTLPGLALAALVGAVGASETGIVGVAWGMTIGYAVVYLLTSLASLGSGLGLRGWATHQSRVIRSVSWYAVGALVAAHVPIDGPAWQVFALRVLILTAWGLPALALWGRTHGWGGLADRFRRRRVG